MKATIKQFLCMAALTIAWGCTSDDETKTSAPFSPSGAPHWAIDWTWNDPEPDWEEPAPAQYECRMYLLMEIAEELQKLSSDEDQMAIFINGTCRGISYPNITPAGEVIFLIHIKGTSQETGQAMELRYYSHKARHLFTNNHMPVFVPNNLMDEAHQLELSPIGTSSKYPLFTQISVYIPQDLPFAETEADEAAVFVGEECRGVLHRNKELYPGWRGNILSTKEGETATVRYYSAEKGGIYTIADGIVLNNKMQAVNAKF